MHWSGVGLVNHERGPMGGSSWDEWASIDTVAWRALRLERCFGVRFHQYHTNTTHSKNWANLFIFYFFERQPLSLPYRATLQKNRQSIWLQSTSPISRLCVHQTNLRCGGLSYPAFICNSFYPPKAKVRDLTEEYNFKGCSAPLQWINRKFCSKSEQLFGWVKIHSCFQCIGSIGRCWNSPVNSHSFCLIVLERTWTLEVCFCNTQLNKYFHTSQIYWDLGNMKSFQFVYMLLVTLTGTSIFYFISKTNTWLLHHIKSHPLKKTTTPERFIFEHFKPPIGVCAISTE